MEKFATGTYGNSGLDNRPLLVDILARGHIIDLVVGSWTCLLILVTLISSFVFPQLPPTPLICACLCLCVCFFSFCISLSSITACILIIC
uniref:Uncharacterized protein n=1 Tax=Vombatus ursinus TaxID=29139 RepID=A0A4X2K6A7_VOMUR